MGRDQNVFKVLVMGVGNTLMQDDGVGIHVAEALRTTPDLHPSLEIIDGGTIGLALLHRHAVEAQYPGLPGRRALVAIQPACTEWGSGTTPEIAAAIGPACEAIRRLAAEWTPGERAA